MKSIFRFLGTALLTVLSLGTVSCEKEEPVTPAPVLKLAKTQVGSGKGSQFVSVQAAGSWTLSSEASWVRFTPSSGSGDNAAVSLNYEANPDDKARSASITLTCGDRKSVVTLRQNAPSEDPQPETDSGSSTKRRWMELPETKDNDGLFFYTHDMTVASKTVRNYSFYCDEKALVARWVAYPLNKGLIGNGSRSNEWGFDPLLPARKQPYVLSTFRGGWTRGHQIPSADRLNYAANVETFYGTNMTPQDYDFNCAIWADLEGKVRSYASQSDTLYVVTGCCFEKSTRWSGSSSGFSVKIPTHYFKALLYKGPASAAKATDGYMAAGYLLPHDSGIANRDYKAYILSIDRLEAETGFDFFPNLVKKIGQDKADEIEANLLSWW